MATVNAVALCPACRVELPYPIPEKCPNCNHKIERPTNESFGSPDYLHDQLEDALESFKDKAALSPAETTEKSEIERRWREWGRDAPIRDRVSAMNDAHHLLSWVLHSNLDMAQAEGAVREMCVIARRIGGLGKALEDYFANGGKAGVTEPRPIRPAPTDDGGGATGA